MVSIGNGIPGNRNGAQYFDEDSDDVSTASEVSPLVRRPPEQDKAKHHVHIITGYLSAIEAILLLLYLSGLIVMTLLLKNSDFVHNNTLAHPQGLEEPSTMSPAQLPDYIVACFIMAHVLVWCIVGVFDRIVQWRHQVLRRKGYLNFYRSMKNVRRVPFIAVSIANGVMLIYVCLLYVFQIHERDTVHGLHAVDGLYIVVGLEMLIVEPCLIYYVVRATLFNYRRQPPDVIKNTHQTTLTGSGTAVGFRDGEDTDELLERQADMIRYLQQHNANLGRRILELQSQNLE